MAKTIKRRVLHLFVVILSVFVVLQPLSAYSQANSQANEPIRLDTTERDAAVKEFNKVIKAKPISSREIFPDLPPSSLCSNEKLVGMWKLLMVYEVPSGREIDSYFSSPMQYLVFEPDSLYGEYVSILHNITLRNIRDTVLKRDAGSQQFAVNQSGIVFLYRNRIAFDSLACFIVEALQPPFRQGQMLLMPPERAAAGKRVLKVYEKVFIEFEAPYNPPSPVQNKPIETNRN